jgi:uncharacterized protein
MGSRFRRYELRTTDVDGARPFYEDLFGAQLWGEDFAVVPLPAAAAARGAPAHWVGYLGVDDVEDMSRRLVAAGAEPRGPLLRADDGALRAVFRDPFGASLGLTSSKLVPREDVLGSRLLHTRDEAPAFSLYASLFGFKAKELADHGPEKGRHQSFAWDDEGPVVGAVTNLASLPHIHAQWLFFFRVASIEDALAKVRAQRGLVLPVTKMANGTLVAGCDDPQGAAFGLLQEPPR